MSKSPRGTSDFSERAETYLSNWSALGQMVSRGMSFSGRERNRAFLNVGAGRFADVSSALGLDGIGDGRGIAVTDWDHDGDLDLWYSNRTGPSVHFMRNDSTGSNHFISFRLFGRTCNRDAIGARLTLISENSDGTIHEQHKSIRAGEGFLSQSSKRIHFGLRSDATIRKLKIRWPGSRAHDDEFAELQSNQHYQIVQGDPPFAIDEKRAVALTASFKKTPAVQGSRTVLTERLPMPTLKCYASDQTIREIPFNKTGPTFVTLWASWCATCVHDLIELSNNRTLFIDQNVQIVAISADGIEGDLEAAKNVIDETKFPFENGFADESLAGQLTELTHNVFYRKLDLSLPTSFLLDQSGRVAVIYQGAIDADQVVADLGLLSASPDRLQTAAFPFPGLRIRGLFDPTPIDLAKTYLAGNYLEDARRQIEIYLASIDKIQDLTQLAERFSKSIAEDPSEKDLPTDTTTLKNILEQQKISAKINGLRILAQVERKAELPEDELRVLQRILKLHPNDLDAKLSAAIAFSNFGKKQKAVDLLRLTEQSNQTNVTASISLAQTYMKLNLPQPAVRILEELHSKNPESLNVRFNLAMVSQLSGNEKKAIDLYESILVKSKEANDIVNNLAWLYGHCESQELRNLNRAKKLATDLCRRTNNQNAAYLDTLSSILIKTGDRRRAAQAALIGERLARQSGQSSLALKIQKRIAELDVTR